MSRRSASAQYRLPELLAALDDADDSYLDAVAQVDCPAWSTGAVGLVTAYVTAAELAVTPYDVSGALHRAEASLRPFVARNQPLGPANLQRMVLPTARAVRYTCWHCG